MCKMPKTSLRDVHPTANTDNPCTQLLEHLYLPATMLTTVDSWPQLAFTTTLWNKCCCVYFIDKKALTYQVIVALSQDQTYQPYCMSWLTALNGAPIGECRLFLTRECVQCFWSVLPCLEILECWDFLLGRAGMLSNSSSAECARPACRGWRTKCLSLTWILVWCWKNCCLSCWFLCHVFLNQRRCSNLLWEPIHFLFWS